ncbi:uncharacterized protein LOC110645450 [Hevea brasiliensis]|uniref:uncharacterized protein LOC110645450 n=1 Tax=Hevea brasiliensis TaxID=3981 RepID=UPI0025EE386E|nr:uncharacterized protein LOC110645450 [Hevea brasiliensis]
MTTQLSNILTGILDNNRLTGPNFLNWLRNLKIFLNLERIGYVLDFKVHDPLLEGAIPKERDTLDRWKEHDMRAMCYMLAFMTNELQKQHKKMQSASKILDHLNCPKYLAFLKSKKDKPLEGTSSNESLDAQDVRLRIGNEATVAALAIGSKSFLRVIPDILAI